MKLSTVAIWSLGLLALGCAPTESIGSGTAGTSGGGTAGTSGGGTAGTNGGGTAGTNGGGTAGTNGGGTAGTNGGGTAGTNGGGTAGTNGGGTAGTNGGGTAGTNGGTSGTTGGTAGTTGGTAGRGGTTGTAGRGGTTGTAGTSAVAGRGGTTGTAGTTGAGGGVTTSSTCRMPAWPTASGSTTVSGTMSVTNYDGMMRTVQGSLEDCSVNGQGSTNATFEVADGGSVKNVIFGTRVGDGIHCLGSCTITNVWFPYICDDAITMLGGSGKTATITNSGFKNARDKVVQHNGDGSTVSFDNIYVETAGKLYRSCGEGSGCGSASARRTVRASNIYAIGVGQLLGVSTNDTATLTNICAYRTPQLCHAYQPGSDTDATNGANGVGEGPSTNCMYTGAQTHALVDHVTGSVTTDVLCTGPNSAKTGSTATNCVSGFDTCLKGCAPGSYGFKQITCSGGKYSDPGSGSCLMPTDATAASKLASTNSGMATSNVTSNASCTTQWAWGKDGSDSTKYCVCVPKPGYYQAGSGWWVWDCQSQWW